MDSEKVSDSHDFLPPKVYRFGPYTLDARPHKREIRLDGKPLATPLTDMEYSVLAFLISKQGARVAPADFPQWGPTTELLDKPPVVSYFSKIKKKMGDPPKGYIRNERNAGYWFAGKLKELEIKDDQTLLKKWLGLRQKVLLGGGFLLLAGILIAITRYMHKPHPTGQRPTRVAESTPSPSALQFPGTGSQKTIIYLANLQGPDNESYRITDTVFSNLKQLSEKYSDIEVVSFGRSINEEEDIKPIRDEMQRKHATLLIWGWYNRTKEKAHVRIHIEPFFAPGFFTSGQLPITLPVAMLEKLDLTLNISKKVNAISLIAEGEILFLKADYKGAEKVFTEAYKQQSSDSVVNLAVLILYIAMSQGAQEHFQQAERTLLLVHRLPHTSQEDQRFYFSFLQAAILFMEEKVQPAANLCRLKLQPHLTSETDELVLKYSIAQFCGLIYNQADLPSERDSVWAEARHFVDTFPYNGLEGDLWQADSYYRVCEFNSALQKYQEADRIKPNDVGIIFQIARMKVAQGDFEGARQYFTQAENLDPTFVPAITAHADAAARTGDLKTALALYKQAEKITSTAPNYLAESDIQERLGDINGALESAEKAINLNPTDASLYVHRGALNSKQKKYDLELADYDTALRIASKNSDKAFALSMKGSALLQQGRLNEALHDFEQSIKLNPTSDAGFVDRAEYYMQVRKFDLSIADYTKAIEILEGEKRRHLCWFPYLPRPYAMALEARGRAFSEKGDQQAALRDFDASLGLVDDPFTHLSKSISLMDVGLNDEAIAEVDRSLRLAPGWAQAYNQRAFLKLLKNQPAEALRDANQAIAIDSETAMFFFNRGQAQERLGLFDAAVADFTTAVKKQPGSLMFTAALKQLCEKAKSNYEGCRQVM